VDYALQAGIPEYRKTADIRHAVFGENPPAAVGVLVEGIPSSSALIIMNAVAMKGGRNKRVVIPRTSPTWKRYNSLTFSPGFYVGDHWFWMSGTTGRMYQEGRGRDVYPEGIQSQEELIWGSSLGEILKEAGIDANSVVRTTDYVHPAAVSDYKRQSVSTSLSGQPTRRAKEVLVVNRLLRSAALLETDATCYLGTDKEIIAPDGIPGISAVRCGKVVFCSSQGPIDYKGQFVVGKGYFDAQVEQTYHNLDEVLRCAGASLKDVVRTIEITSPQTYYKQQVLDDIRRKIFGNALPAVTTVTGNSLLQTGADFSLNAWAILA
jgi:enamine deaminase RidA (YjgF/YER057c/UK114 family)